MTYESKKTGNPANSRSFHSQELLGYTYFNTHPGQWNSVLSSQPTPPQQKASNPKKHGQVEPFKEKISDHQYVFYEPEDERRPLWKCTEWVEWYAIPALQAYGLIQAQVPDDSIQGQSSSSASEWVWDEAAQLYRYWDATANEWIWQGQE